VVDGGGADIQRAAEDVGEAEHVVDLVRVVRTAGGDDGVGADLGDLLRGDLRVGIGHGEDDRVLRHRLDHGGGERALGGQAEDDVGAGHGVGQAARLRGGGMRRLPLVHAFGAALVDDALRVAENDV